MDLPWWPSVDERIRDERAKEVIQSLREIVGLVFGAAVADLRGRTDPRSEIVRSGPPAAHCAQYHFLPDASEPSRNELDSAHAGR